MCESGTIRIASEVGGTCRLTRLRVAAGVFWLGDRAAGMGAQSQEGNSASNGMPFEEHA